MRSWSDYKRTMVQPVTLALAAKENDTEAVLLLMRNQASSDLNERDIRGYSPLMLAVYAGHQEASELLLGMGADPNTSDFNGNSVLMGASFKGHLDLIELLIAKGADLEARNSTGMTALDFANAFGRTEAAKLLMQAREKKGGAKSNQRKNSRMKSLAGVLLSKFIRAKNQSGTQI